MTSHSEYGVYGLMEHQQSIPVNDDSSEMSRRERIKRQQRGEILDAALKLFSERGYHNVSMHEIAREAQFGIGTLYKFFSNKEDLYKALLMGMATKWHHCLLEVLNRKEGNILETIQEFIALRVNLFAENSTIMRLYFAETSGASFNVRAGLEEDLLNC